MLSVGYFHNRTVIVSLLQAASKSKITIVWQFSQGDGEQDEEDEVEGWQLRVSRRQKIRPGIVELSLQLEVHKVWT